MENEWVGIFLQGSQNYELDTPESDIDTWLIVLPTMDDLIFGKQPVSKELMLPDGEHCCVKDIRLAFNMFRKQNINALEMLFTKWRLLNVDYEEAFSLVLANAESIARYDNYRFIDATVGMIREKHKKLFVDSGEYGYAGKWLCHMDRLYEFMQRFLVENESFNDCLISKKKELLLAAKAHRYTLGCAVVTADVLLEEARKIESEYKSNHPREHDGSIETLLDSVASKILTDYIRENIEEYEFQVESESEWL